MSDLAYVFTCGFCGEEFSPNTETVLGADHYETAQEFAEILRVHSIVHTEEDGEQPAFFVSEV